jgi:hypothetical protein
VEKEALKIITTKITARNAKPIHKFGASVLLSLSLSLSLDLCLKF